MIESFIESSVLDAKKSGPSPCHQTSVPLSNYVARSGKGLLRVVVLLYASIHETRTRLCVLKHLLCTFISSMNENFVGQLKTKLD